MNDFLKSLDKEQLIQLCENYAKNWIAHDGCWFQSIEKKLGMEEAIEHDANAWEVFTVVEAKRAKQFLGLGENSNPEFTSSVIVAYARAAYRMNQEGQKGCKTVFDVAPAYLSALSGEELRKHLL